MSNPIRWNLAGVWNQVAMKENKELKPRDYVYASEIGGPMYDRYLKMKGVPFTNPPNNRSLRKFLAGNIFEYLTKSILTACGIFHQEEVKVDAKPYDNCLEVHGRCDFIAGGKIEAEPALRRLNDLFLPDYLHTVGTKIIEALDGKELERKILELKAVSTFAMDKVERSRAAIPQHMMQGYHYQKNGGINAAIGYICKDDCRMAQFDIQADIAEQLYRQDLLKITSYYKTKKLPPLEPFAKWDESIGKFSKNLGVEYSPYLLHYGFEDPDKYRQAVSYIDKWNRALARYVLAETGGQTPTGKPVTITPKNKEVKEEITKAGWNFHDILITKIALGGVLEEEIE